MSQATKDKASDVPQTPALLVWHVSYLFDLISGSGGAPMHIGGTFRWYGKKAQG
jgi:hypothetical protein